MVRSRAALIALLGFAILPLAQSQTLLDINRQTKGNLLVTRLNSGTGASSTTFWNGAGVWTTPASAALVNWTEAVSTTAPNNVTAASSFTAANAATNVDAVLRAKGTGALLAQIPDATTAGGGKRGTYAVDWQMTRTTSGATAQGNWSTIPGGYDNTAGGNYSFASGYGNVSSGAWSFTANRSNTANNNHSTAFGTGNTASGGESFVGGQNSTASANSAFAFGEGVTASGSYSVAFGQKATTRGLNGMRAYASGQFSTIGDAQNGAYVLRVQSGNATPAVMSTTGGGAGSNNGVILPDNSAYFIDGKVIARNVSNGDASSWKFEGAIKRGAGAGTTALVAAITPTMVAQDAGAASWVLAVTADTTNGGLLITVTGASGTTLHWTGVIDTVETQ